VRGGQASHPFAGKSDLRQHSRFINSDAAVDVSEIEWICLGIPGNQRQCLEGQGFRSNLFPNTSEGASRFVDSLTP
jgi:hypothetical protein